MDDLFFVGLARSVAGANALQSVEGEVETERELDVVVARAEDALVAGRHRQLDDPREAGQRPDHGRLVRWGIGRPGLLEQVLGEPEDPAAQHVEGVVGELDREAAVVERRQDRLDVGEAGGAARAALLEDAPRPRVAEHHRRAAIACWRRVVFQSPPGVGRSIWPTIDLDEPVEQVVLAPDVAVEGHRVDAELLAELAHAQGLVAASIGELDGGLQHALPGQGRAALFGRGRLGYHVDRSILTVYGVVAMFTA